MSVQLEVDDIVWVKKDGPCAYKWIVLSVEPCEIVIRPILSTSKYKISGLIEVPEHWAVERNGKVIQ